jgi:hypothetical protein
MGVFDSVLVSCPKCSTLNVVQSKSGPCRLDYYHLDEAPVEVLADINRHPVSCIDCGTPYHVEVMVTTKVINDFCSMSPDGRHKKPSTCTCYILALEPNEDCPVHGYPDNNRCECCGRFVHHFL